MANISEKYAKLLAKLQEREKAEKAKEAEKIEKVEKALDVLNSLSESDKKQPNIVVAIKRLEMERDGLSYKRSKNAERTMKAE